MLLQMIIKLPTLEHSLAHLILVLMRRDRVLSNCISVAIFHGLRRLEIGVFRVIDFLTEVCCGGGGGSRGVVVEGGGGGEGGC